MAARCKQCGQAAEMGQLAGTNGYCEGCKWDVQWLPTVTMTVKAGNGQTRKVAVKGRTRTDHSVYMVLNDGGRDMRNADWWPEYNLVDVAGGTPKFAWVAFNTYAKIIAGRVISA